MYHGRYAHFNNLIESMGKYLDHIKFHGNDVSITINVDGIPLFNDGRNSHAYPILVRLCESPPKIFCAGIYLSEDAISNKMPPVDMFLKQFVEEMKKTSEEEIRTENRYVNLKIKAFICDAPTRADLKKIVGHEAYWACERCSQKGVMAGVHVAMLESDAPKRFMADGHVAILESDAPRAGGHVAMLESDAPKRGHGRCACGNVRN